MLYNLSSQASSLIIYLNALGLKLVVCWDLKEPHIMIIIIKNHKGKISIEFPVSVNSEKSYFTFSVYSTGRFAEGARDLTESSKYLILAASKFEDTVESRFNEPPI